jgi:hypothetical protein
MVRQAGSESRVKTGRTSKNREKEKADARSNTLVDLTKQDELAQTDRKHRYKFPGDGGWRQAQGQVKQIRV